MRNFHFSLKKPSFSSYSPVVKVLTVSDIFVLSGFGLISPIFAVFITDNIVDGSIQSAGVAATIFLFSRSLGQIPIAYIIDRIRGEADDYFVLVVGSLVTCLVPVLYIFVSWNWQLYLVQLVYGISQAATFPTWYALFTRHVDKNKEGTEWGLYNTSTDLGGAFVAGIGGFLATRFGFAPLFLLVSVISFIGSLWLLNLKKHLQSTKKPEAFINSLI